MTEKKPIYAVMLPPAMAEHMAEILDSGQYIVLTDQDGDLVGTVIPTWATPEGFKLVRGSG